MLEFAQQTGGGAKFSIFTGDVVEGQCWAVFITPMLKHANCKAAVWLVNKR
jgi:hypothetical protein